VTDHGLIARLMKPSTRAATIAEVGKTLRRLHDLPVPPDVPAVDPHVHLAKLASTLDGFTIPAFVRAQLERMRAEAAPPSDRALVLSHNDVNPTNLAFDGTRIVLLDWDTAGRNEPFFDLASLAVFLRLDDPTCLALLSAHDGVTVTALPARFVYDRRFIGTLCGCAFLDVARMSGHPGVDLALDAAPTLADVHQRMRLGQLDVRTPEGQWAFGLALVRLAISLAEDIS
jgi:aminoglycoside phosphotransferase (APT) family kinase protein